MLYEVITSCRFERDTRIGFEDAQQLLETPDDVAVNAVCSRGDTVPLCGRSGGL